MQPCSLHRRVLRALLLTLAAFAYACGSSHPEPTVPAAGAEEEAAASDEPSNPAAGSDESEQGGDAGEAVDPEEGTYEAADNKPREIRFLVKPDGLQVDIEGARFRPQAEAFRVGGGWGVRVSVEAASDDDDAHALLSTEDGALAFAGKTVRRGGKEERFGDQRRGGEDQMLFPGAPVTLTREWPGSTGQAPLKAGDDLRLEVGLWGLGALAESRRPVKKFFLIRMKVGRGTPDPVISPPSM